MRTSCGGETTDLKSLAELDQISDELYDEMVQLVSERFRVLLGNAIRHSHSSDMMTALQRSVSRCESMSGALGATSSIRSPWMQCACAISWILVGSFAPLI